MISPDAQSQTLEALHDFFPSLSPQPIQPVMDLFQPRIHLRTFHVPLLPASLNLFLLSYTQTGLWQILNFKLSPI